MKKRKLIISISIVFLLGFIIIYLIHPQFIFERGLPSYAKELPANFEEASNEFNKQIQMNFPTPIEENQLISKLSDEGFLHR